MNITSHAPILSTPTVANPPTDALRRENHQREVITQPAATAQSAAEKGVASERERARTPAQNNEQVDFETLRKQAELANKTISEEDSRSGQDSGQSKEEGKDSARPEAEAKNADGKESNDESKSPDDDLTREEQQTVKELKQRDREVRSHEMAHASAGGPTTGAPSYTFEVGPDGKQYAVEGEVAVDLSPVKGNPRATIAKMQKVYNAALAPANPSIQDTRVANSAAQLIAKAQSELLAEQLEDPEREKELGRTISHRAKFTGEIGGEDSSSDFDRQINATLEAQEQIAPSRSNEIDQRALRIENFYQVINQAYEKPPSHQFELTA